MSRSRSLALVEAALSVALAAVLHFVRIWQMPAGGTVSLEMLPIIVVAVRRGPLVGIAAGALFGVVDLFLEPYVVYWAQFLLDYPIAFGALGLAGVVRPMLLVSRRRAGAQAVTLAAGAAILGTLIGGSARFLAHFLSGILFFAANAPKGQPVAVYSAVYNASYLLPSLIACAAIAAVLLPVLQRAVPVKD